VTCTVLKSDEPATKEQASQKQKDGDLGVTHYYLKIAQQERNAL